MPYYNPHIGGICSQIQHDFAVKIVVFEDIGQHRIGDEWKKIAFRHDFYYLKNFCDLFTLSKHIKPTDIVGALGISYNYFYSCAVFLAASRADKIQVFSEGFRSFSYLRSALVSLFPWRKTTLFGIGRGAINDYKRHCIFQSIDNYVTEFAYPFDLDYPLLDKDSRPYFSSYCGQLIKRKNVESFLRFAQRILKHKSSARFQIIGDGAEEGKLKRYCDELGLSGQVDWKGNLSRYEVLEAFTLSQSFYLNSHYEGWGAVCLEAMSCGCFLILGDSVRSNILISSSFLGLSFKEEDELDILKITSELEDMDLPRYLQIQNRSKDYSVLNLYKLLEK